MGRVAGKFSPESVDTVVAYLKQAALKGAAIFKGRQAPAAQVAALERALRETGASYRHMTLGDWVVAHLTPEGRTRMLATLRRRRADAKAKRKPVNLRLPPRDAEGVEAFARQVGLPKLVALRCLIEIGRADPELRRQVATLAVVVSGRRRMRPGARREGEAQLDGDKA